MTSLLHLSSTAYSSFLDYFLKPCFDFKKKSYKLQRSRYTDHNFCRFPVTFPAHMIVMIICSTSIAAARFSMTVSSSAAIWLTVLLPVDPPRTLYWRKQQKHMFAVRPRSSISMTSADLVTKPSTIHEAAQNCITKFRQIEFIISLSILRYYVSWKLLPFLNIQVTIKNITEAILYAIIWSKYYFWQFYMILRTKDLDFEGSYFWSLMFWKLSNSMSNQINI